jgi:glucose-6-phosphate 1-dehydrogenase
MRCAPRSVFDERISEPCNYVRFRLGPDVTTAIGVRSKALGERMVGETVELVPTSRRGARRQPYARLLEDAMDGDPMLFATWEAIEAQWRIVEPVLGDVTPLYDYERGMWGPPELDRFIVPPMGWRNPQAPRPPSPEPAYAPPAYTG